MIRFCVALLVSLLLVALVAADDNLSEFGFVSAATKAVREPLLAHDGHESLTYKEGWDLALRHGKPLVVWTGKGLCET